MLKSLLYSLLNEFFTNELELANIKNYYRACILPFYIFFKY